MDPIGFALENFDAIGGWRDSDSGAAIDATSTLADGTKIAGPQAFREMLSHGNEFPGTVTEKLLSYALGRSVEYYDQPALRELGYDAGDFPNSERLASSSLSLPMFPEMSLEDLDVVVAAIDEFFGQSVYSKGGRARTGRYEAPIDRLPPT